METFKDADFNNVTFQAVVKTAIAQRPTFKAAIGYGENITAINVPSALYTMYSVAAGTHESIEDQSVMDIIPGLRLIHASELSAEIAKFHHRYPKLNDHLPFLADYSSCYMAIDITDGTVCRVAPEYGTSKVASSLDSYWETVLACYKEGAFFLDSEGYLDFSFEQEGDIGKRINIDCQYWLE